MEVALNGVPSHSGQYQNTHMIEEFYLITWNAIAWATEVVTVDVVDILWERIILAKIGMLHDLEKSTDYDKGIMKSPDLYMFKYSNQLL